MANDFYRRMIGLDAPVANLLWMLWMFAGFAAFVGGGAVIAIRTGTPSPGAPVAARWRIARLAFLAAVILLVPLSGLPSALPLMVLTAIAAFAIEFVRRLADRAGALRMLPMLMWSAFALVLLAKIGLNARLFHYGFYLALPAVTVTIVFLVWLVPQWLDRLDRTRCRPALQSDGDPGAGGGGRAVSRSQLRPLSLEDDCDRIGRRSLLRVGCGGALAGSGGA